jgi:hypothetical protein
MIVYILLSKKAHISIDVEISQDLRASEINNYPKIAPDFGPDTRRFE